MGEVVVGDILQVAGSSSSLPYCSLMIYHHLTLMIMMMPLMEIKMAIVVMRMRIRYLWRGRVG